MLERAGTEGGKGREEEDEEGDKHVGRGNLQSKEQRLRGELWLCKPSCRDAMCSRAPSPAEFCSLTRGKHRLSDLINSSVIGMHQQGTRNTHSIVAQTPVCPCHAHTQSCGSLTARTHKSHHTHRALKSGKEKTHFLFASCFLFICFSFFPRHFLPSRSASLNWSL